MLFNLIDAFQDQLESLGLWSALQVLYQEEFRALAAVPSLLELQAASPTFDLVMRCGLAIL